MKSSRITLSIFTLALVIIFSACNKEPGMNPGAAGAVFIMDNAPSGNNIIAFARAADGSLSSAGSYATKGMGTGSGLGSQGSVIIHDNYLYACNAGSNEITVFKFNSGGLTWIDKISSYGVMPVSLSVHGNLLYVLNAGKVGNISGFRIRNNGHLEYMQGSERMIGSGGAQVEFSPAGNYLAVTQKPDNIIYTFPVNANGLPGTGKVNASAGQTPFGFKFTKQNLLIVSEAFGGAPGGSAVSSYKLENNGNLQVVTASAATHQTAACWIAVTNDARFCYTTNAGSASVSGYKIQPSGELSLIDANGVTGVTGAGATDLSTDKDSRFLYTLNGGAHSISIFKITNNGNLASAGEESGMPATAAGIAAW
jgi:6-phosphogluconolactonase (cycloisomerase 2 family)